MTEQSLPEPDDAAHRSAPIVIEVETSVDERLLALRANGARLKPAVRAMLGWRYWLFIVIACAISTAGAELTQSQPWLGGTILGVVLLGVVLWAQQQRFVLLARSAIARYRVSVSAEGLLISSEIGENRLGWNAVSLVESRDKATLIFLRGYQCLLIPHRCFADDAARHAFVASLETGSAQSVRHLATSNAPAHPYSSFASALCGNLWAGFLLLCMRRNAIRHLHVSVPQLVAVFALPIFISLSGDLLRIGLDGRFNSWGITGAFYGLPWLLLTAWACARLAGNERMTLPAALAVQSMWCWMAMIAQGLLSLPQETWQAAGSAAVVLWWLPFAYAMLAAVPALVRSTGMAPEQRVGAVLVVLYLLALPLIATPRNQYLWVANQDEQQEQSAEQRERWEAPTREAMLYSQPRLLAGMLDRIKPGQPGKPELFLIAVGGHGNQDVFMREVKSVETLFAERFGTAGHSAALLNNPTTLGTYPLASVTALEQTVAGMAQRMNRDEDVLLVFMTSHGGDDFRFDLSMWPYTFDDLTPQRLKGVLDKAGIRHRVVIVSSCYSGGFVPPLADANTWVMTAARADRNSHGCSHEADWTFFGRAFFDEGLRQTRSFEEAFDMAKKAIAEREKNEELTPSEPQTGGGEAVKALLRTITESGQS